jgi:hypothetical protein
MRRQGTAFLLFGLVTAVTAVAQPPSAQDDAMPLLRNASRVALRNVRIIDGTGAPATENQTVVIESGTIRAVGSITEVAIPEGTRTLDLNGRTVLPGFVMLHEHMSSGGAGRPTVFSSSHLYLAFGVTTIRTAGTDHPYVELNFKRRIDRGEVPGPEVHLTSPFFNGEGSPFPADKIVRDSEDARRAVRYWAAEGFTSFKVYQSISKDASSAIIDEAHGLGLPVTAHLRSVSCHEAVELGIDNLEHAFGPCRMAGDEVGTDANGPQAQKLINLFLTRKVVLTFTPTTHSLPLSSDQVELLHPERRDRYEHEQRAAADSPPDRTIGRYAGLLTLAFARAGGSCSAPIPITWERAACRESPTTTRSNRLSRLGSARSRQFAWRRSTGRVPRQNCVRSKIIDVGVAGRHSTGDASRDQDGCCAPIGWGDAPRAPARDSCPAPPTRRPRSFELALPPG